MLSIVDKKGRVVGPLGSGDQEAMLAAFAYSGATAAARERGANVVRTAQQRECWFRCDCLEADSAPILVPVAEAYVRRSPHHPEHAEGCPFEMTTAERESHAASLREPEAGGCFQLARCIGQHGAALVREAGSAEAAGDVPEAEDGEAASRGVHSARRERTLLSQMLFKLLSDARLHQVGRGPRGHAGQQAALYKAARGISLGGDLRLSGVLRTDAGQLDDLVGQVRQRARWPDGRRPHAVLVFAAERIEDDVIVAVSGARLTVEGPIAVFGPGHGRVRTGPFVVAVLVASPDGRGPLLPIRAYAQPCWSATDMLPLDSKHEARSLDILVGFQGWMAGQGYAVEITKPLHDRSRHFLGSEAPDQIVKPDFEGKVFASDGVFLRSLVVETMGFSHPAYRDKKRRLKEILTKKPGHYLEHLAHDGIGQAEGDLRFRKDLLKFGNCVIDKHGRRGAVPLQPPAAAPVSPVPLPAQPQACPLPAAPPPALAEVWPGLSGTPAPHPAAAFAEPDAAPRRHAGPGLGPGWLAHRILNILRGKR